MIDVVGVRFKNAGKVYYFDPDEKDFTLGSNVIVETARGMEFGTVAMEKKAVSQSSIVQPLKKIVRHADDKDVLQYKENLKKKEKAIELCQEKIDKHGLDMKLIDVEYTFDNSKIIFYFTADGRVDFRELVKDLAGVFRMRIELRQIGVRDEAKMLGGIGACGRSLCCSSWLADFEPVSIKMAKVQNLSLNPTKISGICGRLMCCLKYENDTYMQLRKGMPYPGERISTPEGHALVIESNILENKIKVRLILEERREDKPEKVSTEVYVYNKKEIKRFSKDKNGDKEDIFEDIDADTLDEIKVLLKD
ncbi:MAG: stage 0 sporulation family protein [Eubacteriales bacterium]|nr:stage 0 sporulation family protein [Eubacteriales bacterium]